MHLPKKMRWTKPPEMANFTLMKRILTSATLLACLIILPGLTTSCVKSGCPANMALQNETTGGPGKKKSKSNKPQSGIIPQEGSKKKY